MPTSVQRTALIAGAGIAGPSLAYWLSRTGWTVTVVERAPALREGGQAVDFRGPVHRRVLEGMDLWQPIHDRQTRLGSHELLGRDGRPRVVLPAMMMSGDVEILRGDLVRLLYERTSPRVAYRFGDAIVAIADDGTVELERGPTARYDLVVAADGLRSHTRGLVFDDVTMRHHGYRVAGCTIPNVLDLANRGVTYSRPGRGISVASARDPAEARLLFVHRAPPLATRDRDVIVRELADAFAGTGWAVPRLLDEAVRATDLYVDDVSTVHAPRFACRNVVLLGDAAHGGTLGGQGTSVAMVGAYILASELATSPDDLPAAFARYEQRLRPYATRCQKGAARVGGFFAPRTRPGLWMRDAMYRALTTWPLDAVFERLVTGAANDLALPAAPCAGVTPSAA